MNNIQSIEVSTDPTVLEKYSRDISNFKLVPKAVYFPKNTAEVQEIVKQGKEEGIPVSVRAGGTCMSGGSLTTGYILDLTKY
jgi:FAD/FMN-containing dehydrogenase